MQLKSIYFTILIVIRGVISLAPTHASDDYDDDDHEEYKKSYRKKRKNKGSKNARKKKKQIVRVVSGIAFVIYFIWGSRQSSNSEKKYFTKKKVKARKTTPIAKIDPNGNIKARINNDVFFTKYNLSDENLFVKLGCKPKDVLILNAANKELSYNMAGTNGALSDQNNYLLEKKKKEESTFDIEKFRNWGTITDRNGKIWLSKEEKDQGLTRNLKIAQEYAISKNTATGLTIAHIAGVDFSDKDQRQYFPYLKGTIKQMLKDNIGKYPVILLCTISTAIFAPNVSDKRLALQANLDGIEEAIKEVLLEKQKLNTRIFCNGFDVKFPEGYIIGNLDRSGIEYTDENLPKVEEINTN